MASDTIFLEKKNPQGHRKTSVSYLTQAFPVVLYGDSYLQYDL